MMTDARVEQLWKQAHDLVAQDKAREAADTLATLLRIEPSHTGAYLLSAALAYTQGSLRLSAHHALSAACTPIRDATTLANVVMALLRTGEIAQAHRCVQNPLVAGPLPGPLLMRFAQAQQAMEQHPDALSSIQRAIAAGTTDPGTRFAHSIELMFNGDRLLAETELQRALQAGLGTGRAWLMLARLRTQESGANHIAEIRERIRHTAANTEDQAALQFALYKELEDIGAHADAWEPLERGNAIMFARLRPDAVAHTKLVDQLIASPIWKRPPPPATESEPAPQPIFIIGMPRSGTTLIDRIIGGHSDVTSAGELGDFARQLRWMADHVGNEPIDHAIIEALTGLEPSVLGSRYLQQTQWRSQTRFFTDKLPVNYLLAGLIAHALPGARILHMVRDPMSLCFSNYRAFFGNGYGYSYDQRALLSRYRDYMRLMAHWHRVCPGRILDVSYQRLTADPEPLVREVMTFCGLDFESECLDLRRNKSPIATLSAPQMDSGIHSSQADAWSPYATRLQALSTGINAGS